MRGGIKKPTLRAKMICLNRMGKGKYIEKERRKEGGGGWGARNKVVEKKRTTVKTKAGLATSK